MCSHIVSSILNHLLFDILSGILSGMNLAVYLEYTHILTYYIVGHSIWQSYLKYMGVDQNIVAGVLLEMTLRPPLRFLALFRVFIVFHYMD